MATSVATKNEITLKGSVDIVTEFFGYSINSILYQRGLYPPESFTPTPKYGLSLLVTKDPTLKTYIASTLSSLRPWLSTAALRKLVLVITDVATRETLERWVFNIQTDEAAVADGIARSKPVKEIQSEIAGILRQITASVSFLPMLEGPCTFEVLVYTAAEAPVTGAWEDSDPKYIAGSEEVKLRSFSTSIHTVAPVVSYKISDGV